MEIYAEVLLDILRRDLKEEKVQVVFPNLKLDASALVRDACCCALGEIKAVIEDESLDDPACFRKVEEIICVLERTGCDVKKRHKFQ